VRVVQISDTHLFDGGGVTISNVERVIEFVNDALRPDLVIHSGDIVGLDPDHAGDRGAALGALAGLRAPLLAVPGNHDVGEPGERPWMGIAVTSERVAAHRRTVGEVPFLETAGDWGLLGLNSQVIGSGLPEEEEQWRWLEEALARTSARSLLLFMHKPLWDTGYTHWGEVAVPAAAPERLFSMRGSDRLRAVTNGHLHCYRRRVRPALLEVWGPSTAAIGGATEEPSLFGQCGVVEWTLGDGDVQAHFRAPATLDERTFDEIPEFAAALDELARRRDVSPGGLA
jgi:3',5'-cyclic AMP phosphodiesterase CpdA